MRTHTLAVVALAALVNIGFFYVREDGLRGALAPAASRCVSYSLLSICRLERKLVFVAAYLCR